MGYSNKWNQPGSCGGNSSPRSPRLFWVRGLAAGALVVFLGLGAWLWLSKPPDDEASDVQCRQEEMRHSAKSQSPTVTIGKTETAVAGIPAQTVVSEPKTNQWGNPAHWGHKKLRPANYIKVDESKLPLEERIFHTKADKDIAGLLVVEPGADLIGSDEFDERFVKSFLKSLEQPIVIGKEDSDEEKKLKRAVIDTKIELKARYDAGEDIAKILTDIRRELRELGAYREDLKKELDNLRRDGNVSVQEMKEYVDAANIMLEQRGAKRIVMPEFYYKQIEFRNQMKQAEQGE